MLQQVIHGGSAIGVLLDHGLDDGHEVVGVEGGDAVEFARFDLHGELVVGRGFEGGTEGSDLVDDATRGPDVRFFIVLLIVDLLGAHVVRSTNMSISKHRILIHNPRESKIPKFNILLRIEENVTRLKITMENFALFAIVT